MRTSHAATKASIRLVMRPDLYLPEIEQFLSERF